MFHQAVQNLWCVYKSACVLVTPRPAVSFYKTDGAQARTRVESDLLQKVAEVKQDDISLGAFLSCARCEQIELPV